MLRTVSSVTAALAIMMAAAAAQTVPVPRAVTRDAAPKPPPLQNLVLSPSNSAVPVQSAVNQDALVDRVSTYLSGMKTLVGDFVQVGPDGRRTEGQFYVQ